MLLNLAQLSTLSKNSYTSLDKKAEDLLQNLRNSYARSAKNSLPHNREQPWWNQDCRGARKTYRDKLHSSDHNQADRKVLCKVVKRAKAKFFQKVVERVPSAKDAFDTSRWHKSKGNFRTSPLIDPLNQLKRKETYSNDIF